MPESLEQPSVPSAGAAPTPETGTVWDVEEVWGSDLDGATPGMTLKGPGDVAGGVEHLFAAQEDDAPPNLSDQGYDVEARLGAGAVGIVFRAVQRAIERPIALKMVRPQFSDDEAEKHKFITEAVITGKLDHPNIVPVHDLGTTRDGHPFYTMKMVRGTPWSEVMDQRSLDENLRILLDVCDAVAYAHAKGVIHRDLKPENVMLGEFGEVQVMDWGLGVVVNEDGVAAGLTPADAAGGTPAYMAPEMVTGRDGPVGVFSDIYLLGGQLYRIITGKPPHPGKTTLVCLRNAQNNVIDPPDGPGVLGEIALRAMHTDPAQRYPSVRALILGIQEYQQHAVSIRLAERSAADLARAQAQRDYALFSQALFGYREALKSWSDNQDARWGVLRTQYAYAQCAHEKGDYDLAISLLDTQCAEHQPLREEVQRAQRRRASVRRGFRALRLIAIGLMLAVIVTLTCAYVWVSAARAQAEAAREAETEQREKAELARAAERQQRELAEEATARAKSEEARAVQALADLEKAFKELVEAQEQERQARARAEKSEQETAKTRDELAKSGMLLDNSWWTFTPDEARSRQSAAAEDLGLPAEWTIALPNDVALEMIVIPPGDFVMGSPPKEEMRAADEHLHRVSLTYPFYMSRYELTEAQWHAATGQPPASAAERDPDATLPATGASFDQITAVLVTALARHAPPGHTFRLPTEAEWEYACRAGTTTAYYGGDTVDQLGEVGWYLGNGDCKVQPVGQKAPNAFGLYDMHGNVSEPVVDRFAANFYLDSPVANPVGPMEGDFPILRGGSALNTAEHCRAAYRSNIFHENEYGFVGVRVVLVADDIQLTTAPIPASQPSAAAQENADEPQP